MSGNSMRKQRQAERNWSPPPIEPQTRKQATYLDLLERLPCLIVEGPAGTGKTYLACAWAGQQLLARNTDAVILTRPVVGVGGKTMGFLPGNEARKMGPWARPLVEAFKRNMSAKKYDEAAAAGQIRVEPLEYIRGLTFDRTIMIIDEAQNTTPKEMKAFLTRIGDESRVIICGDPGQSDIDPVNNGLAWASAAVARGLVPDTGAVTFTSADVVRSALCRAWGEAFDTMEAEQREKADLTAGLRRTLGG
ncbi:phosphate starvation-inducible protein [Pseudanabaena phage Pan1]|nr:phosphate starvation-inducible protein [Pseudanabaena phage Pan1]